MKIALVQMEISPYKEENLKKAEKLVSQVSSDVDIIIFPELMVTSYERIKENIVTQNDPYFELFKNLSLKRVKTIFLAGTVPYEEDKILYNKAFIFQDGEIKETYTKIHSFKLMEEEKIFKAGNKIVTSKFETKSGLINLGIIICYDLRFPELTRIQAKRGIELLLVPAQWPKVRSKIWQTLLRARAMENHIFVAGVNRAGSDITAYYGGNSLLIDPLGEDILNLGEGEKVLEGEIDLNKILQVKRKINSLNDIREDIYMLCERKDNLNML